MDVSKKFFADISSSTEQAQLNGPMMMNPYKVGILNVIQAAFGSALRDSVDFPTENSSNLLSLRLITSFSAFARDLELSFTKRYFTRPSDEVGNSVIR